VYLEGRKRTESWDDKKTGAKNYRDLVYVDRIEFLDSRTSGNGSSRAHPTSDEQSTVPGKRYRSRSDLRSGRERKSRYPGTMTWTAA